MFSNTQVAVAGLSLKNKLKEACLSDENWAMAVHFIPTTSTGTMASIHSIDYVKDSSRTDQCRFIQESLWWVPTVNGNSGSLLDKLFYTSF